jgi:hypothetical protein
MQTPALAKTQVGTIFGAYDAQCGVNGFDCTFGTGLPVNNPYGSNPYDTPNLWIINSGNNPFTNMSLTLTGYQGDNNGLTATIALPDVAAHSILMIPWVSQDPSPLFRYDYDDEYGHTTTSTHCASLGQGLCADTGNFDALVTGMLNGHPIASDFSPDNTQDGGNQQGSFVGWEGLDPQGFSESTFDVHSGTNPGVLAFIFTGVTGRQVPEPLTLSLFGTGLGALLIGRRRRKKQ